LQRTRRRTGFEKSNARNFGVLRDSGTGVFRGARQTGEDFAGVHCAPGTRRTTFSSPESLQEIGEYFFAGPERLSSQTPGSVKRESIR